MTKLEQAAQLVADCQRAYRAAVDADNHMRGELAVAVENTKKLGEKVREAEHALLDIVYGASL